MNLIGTKKWLKRIFLGLVVISIIGSISMLIKVKINTKQEIMVLQPPLVKTLKIATSNKDSDYVYAGAVQPRYKSQLAFQVGGKIVNRNVEVGDRIEQGTVLMELDSRDIEQAVNNNAAAVSAAESKYKLAIENLKRFDQLYQSGAVSKVEYDNYANLLDTAKAALEQTTALYTQSKNQLGYCQLHTDKSGVIGSVDAEEGQVVTAGQKVITLIQNNELEVEINVPENRLDKIKSAKEINLSFWALPDVKTKGTLREISPVANDASRTYRVRISLSDPPSKIQMGMSSNVSISGNHSPGKVWIPLAAVYQTTSSPAVWVVQKNTVVLKNITLADFSDDQVTVSSGLNAGDVVVTAGVTNLREGQEIRTGGDKE